MIRKIVYLSLCSEVVREFEKLFSDGNYSYSTGVGAGYLLIEGSFQHTTGEQPYLYLASLENRAEEPIVAYLGDIGSSLRVGVSPRAFGDWVFYKLYEEEEQDIKKLMGYQISTGETVELTEQQTEWYEDIEFLMMQEGTVYWCTYADGIFACDMDTRKVRQVVEWGWPVVQKDGGINTSSIAADQEYIYYARQGRTRYIDETSVREEKSGDMELTIYDLEGQEIQQLSYEWEEKPLEYLMATPDYIIWGENGGFQNTPTCYLKRSDIAEGKAEFIKLGQ